MNPLALLSSLSNLPSIQTRKALLLLDFQNDFVRPNGRLPVPKTQDFIDLIPSLVQSFRRSGEVVWVRTQYEAPRPIIDDYGSEIIITAAGSLDTKSKRAENQGRQKAHNDDTVDPEAFLSTPVPACLPQTTGVQFPAPILTAMDPEHDLVIDKSDYSALQSPGLVLSLRSRFVTELYICGSLSNVSVYATALDAAQQGFSITLIEDCMGYRNFARHEEAIRRLADIVGADGISAQELIEEGDWEENEEIAQASRSSKHDRARPQPKHISHRPEPTGPTAIESVLDHLAVQTSPMLGQQTSAAPKQTDSSSVTLHVSEPIEADDDPYPSDEHIILPPTKYLRASNFRANKETRTSSGANTSSRARRNKSSSSPTSSRKSAASESPIQGRASTSPVLTTTSLKISKNPAASSGAKKLQSPQQDAAKYAAKGKSTTKLFLGPDDPIAEGDSRIVYDLDLPADAFAKVQKEVNWQKMYHLSGQVPRLVAVQGVVFHDDSYPIYRHPADESPVLERFTATVDAIRRSAEQTVGHELNHVLIQMYRDGQDNISEHSDKTLDIVRDSSIVNVSLGAQRVMTLRTKKSAVTREGDDDSARRKQQVPMPHGSMFILGPASNTRWLHGIRPDKRSESEKSNEEKAFHGQRISLTFRNIGTFTNPHQSTIWGQGAVSKRAETARKVVHADASETERLIQAFGAENRESDFDWDAVYGRGFDVINFVQPAIARISLSGDPIADLRVRLCLTENGMRYEIVTPVSGQNTQDVVYSSPDGKAVVKGDIQILLHLASLDQNSSLARPGVGLVRKGRFLTEITELDRAWREHLLRGSRADFDRLAVWNEKFETIAADGQQSFVAGPNLTIDDLALWPILHQIESQTGVFHASSKYPFLSAYYLRLQKRGCVRVVLDELAHE